MEELPTNELPTTLAAYPLVEHYNMPGGELHLSSEVSQKEWIRSDVRCSDIVGEDAR